MVLAILEPTTCKWFYPSYGLNKRIYLCFSAVCNRTIQRERKCVMKCNLSAIFVFFLFFPPLLYDFTVLAIVFIFVFRRFVIGWFSVKGDAEWNVIQALFLSFSFFPSSVAWFYPSYGLSNSIYLSFCAVCNRIFQRPYEHIKPVQRPFMLLHSIRLDASLSSRPLA